MLNGFQEISQKDREDMLELIKFIRHLKLEDKSEALSVIEQSPHLADKTYEALFNITPLLNTVIENCSLEVFNKVLSKTTNVNAQRLTQGRPDQAVIHLLAKYNLDGYLVSLFAKENAGININLKDADGETAVHTAANVGAIEALRVLIANNADVNIPNCKGQTPLQTVCYRGNFTAVICLLHAGAKVNTKDNKGLSAIHCLAQSPSTDVNTKNRILSLLLEWGTSINERSKQGNNAIDMATGFNKESEFIETLTKEKVPSLLFQCVNFIKENWDHPAISNNVSLLPEDLTIMIDNTKRATT